MAVLSKSELIKLQKTLQTDAAIGKKFHVTRQAIHQLRKKYGIESSRVDNSARNEQILALFNKGNTGAAIAKKLDLSVSQVYRIVNDAGGGRKSRKAAKKRK